MDEYISFNYGGLRFIDSFAFLSSGLGALVENTLKETDETKEKRPEEKLRKIAELAKDLGGPFELLVKKGTYPYEYVDNFEKFKETALPPKDCLFSTLADKGIDEEEWAHGQEVWKKFGWQNLGNYHDVYMQTDVAQLADVFENFRELCLGQYGLDPAHYLTAPGLAWDALLKKSGAELELLTDYDMHMFIENGMRGGISMASKRHAKANKPYVPGYDDSLPSKHLIYLEAKPLPIRKFRWSNKMFGEEEIIALGPNEAKGYILEVDLEYPRELHEAHNAYPLAPEKKQVQKEWLSPYQNYLLEKLGRKKPQAEKLLLTLHDKEKYVVHYQTLQL